MTRTELQKKSKGSTEQMQEGIYGSLERELLEKFQIWFSVFDETKVIPEKNRFYIAMTYQAIKYTTNH